MKSVPSSTQSDDSGKLCSEWTPDLSHHYFQLLSLDNKRYKHYETAKKFQAHFDDGQPNVLFVKVVSRLFQQQKRLKQHTLDEFKVNEFLSIFVQLFSGCTVL